MLENILIPVVAILSVFIGAPSIIFGFIWKIKQQKHEIQMLEKKQELVELEIERDMMKVKALETESKYLDRYIEK